MQNGHIEIEFSAATVVGQKERRCAVLKHFFGLLMHQIDSLVSSVRPLTEEEHEFFDRGCRMGIGITRDDD
ncbi:hypothetical protein [Candidatus Ferrigenium straubiae]|jgi:hypothetical protein|uniref:hypothetical protein n=1 Tax=Candidatus Ferrigenium straubiae TaxID=2919506 RepID=UPI003F4AD946